MNHFQVIYIYELSCWLGMLVLRQVGAVLDVVVVRVYAARVMGSTLLLKSP